MCQSNRWPAVIYYFVSSFTKTLMLATSAGTNSSVNVKWTQQNHTELRLANATHVFSHWPPPFPSRGHGGWGGLYAIRIRRCDINSTPQRWLNNSINEIFTLFTEFHIHFAPPPKHVFQWARSIISINCINNHLGIMLILCGWILIIRWIRAYKCNQCLWNKEDKAAAEPLNADYVLKLPPAAQPSLARLIFNTSDGVVLQRGTQSNK